MVANQRKKALLGQSLSLVRLSVFALTAAFCLYGCGESKSSNDEKTQIVGSSSASALNVVTLSADAQKAMALQIDQAADRPLDIYVTIPGEVQADANLVTHVNAPISGRAVDVFPLVGDSVHADKELANIRSTDIEQLEADLLQNLAQIQADLKQN